VPAVSAIAAGQDNSVVSIAAEGPNAYALLVSADSDITSVAELKGKTIATVVGSTGHNLVEKLLSQEGLSIDTDVTFVNISAGDAATVLDTDQADAVAIWEPNVTRLIENGTAKAIAYGRDCGLLGVNPLMVNTEFAKENPTIVKVINEQYKRGVDEIPNMSEDTLKYVSEYLSIDEDQVATVAGNWDYTIDITQDDIDGLQDTISFLVKIGNLAEEYDIADYIYEE
jgi:sulfonate transport system substrate-binding protein